MGACPSNNWAVSNKSPQQHVPTRTNLWKLVFFGAERLHVARRRDYILVPDDLGEPLASRQANRKTRTETNALLR